MKLIVLNVAERANFRRVRRDAVGENSPTLRLEFGSEDSLWYFSQGNGEYRTDFN